MSDIFMNVGILSMLLMSLRAIFMKSADIPTKKMKKNLICENPLISGIFGTKKPGITDIAVKKKIKDLTFIFGCAKRMW